MKYYDIPHFVVKNDSYGELIVYEKNYKTGELKPYDDRGHLFVAIRNLIIQMIDKRLEKSSLQYYFRRKKC